MDKSTVWGFVEKHYPNYHSSSDIIRADYLFQILFETMQEGSEAERIFIEEFGSSSVVAGYSYDELTRTIYEQAIANFLSKQKEQDEDEYRPISILNVSADVISSALYDKLHKNKAWTYEDKKGLQEHLFSCAVRDNGDIQILWTSEQEEELRKIEQQCADKDCGYFRIISS